ncbi:PD-(D/E)XK nuclease family protein [Zoogloea sp.]|uniref:PD-(D/E)XK nuclease family protein n=1 Tax=Zoogloea sp. TaxID=49181 RepID=UPI00261E2972|nr:PD-(D/E)XK nuclease family protein [Zoogloea sp.]MDD3353252.1 PD-(D/E)XK nuclease family protein [Zoogloea sp.]
MAAVSGGEPVYIALRSGGDFVSACAEALLKAEPDTTCRSKVSLILPNLLLARDFRMAMAARAGGPVLVPPMQTLPAALAPWLVRQAQMAGSRRLLGLYQALKDRQWLDEGSLWGICEELIALFDELTLHGLGLPGSEDQFREQLAAAYQLKADEPLRFEARLVHALWLADGQGLPSRAAARLLAGSDWACSLTRPLYVIAEGAPGPFERRLFHACAEKVPVTVFVPDRSLAVDPVMLTLNAAWPASLDPAPLARRLVSVSDAVALTSRVALMATQSLEQQAEAVVVCVRRWLAAGRQRIALVAADRVAARRARALLERDGVLVEDETGWKLSTTRAASLVDAWLEVLASDGYHRDVLDLLKSPFMGGQDETEREAGIEALAALYARHDLASGLEAAAALADASITRCLAPVLQARDALPRSAASPSLWLQRLADSLTVLGVMPLLQADGAGAELLAWMETRRSELAEERGCLDFFEWRDWLNRELESAMYRPRTVESPVVMTHLAAARLRRFEAAVVIGADVDNLAPEDKRPVFAHEAVRAELGLPGRADARSRLVDDLASLIAFSDEVVFVWQHLRDGEILLPNDSIELLSLAHKELFNDDLMRPAPRLPVRPPDQEFQDIPAPSLTSAQVPGRISASALASLIGCPYQYFARHVLGLGESEEVSEALEKSDYGQMIHSVLQAFHGRFPRLGNQSDEVLVAALEEESRRVFGPALARNFLEHAWFSRWMVRVAAYIEWQRSRESDGWFFAAAELKRERELILSDGSALRLYGRLDRLDRQEDGRAAVLDYKSRSLRSLQIQARNPDDVQLAVYALLQGGETAEAAYVALDDETVGTAPLADLAVSAAAQQSRLLALFDALRGGAPLPANGSACAHCEMRGLCRKDFHP